MRDALHLSDVQTQANLVSVGTARSIRCSMGGSGRAIAQGFESLICRHFALLAQLVEHFHGKEGVAGSSPAEGSAKAAA